MVMKQNTKHTIMVVDDEVDNVEVLERIFRKKYHVLKATSGVDALEVLKKEKVSVIISDQRMPQMTGVEFLTQSIQTHPSTIRILLTGYSDIESVIDAINSGQIYRYITKPWDSVDLLSTVDRGVERYELDMELKEKNKALSKAVSELQTLDKAKTQFMVLINHELKTPLTTLISFKDLLSETSLNTEQKKYIKRIDQSIDKLRSIISDVLEMVSAQNGQVKLDPQPHQVEALIVPILDKVLAKKKKIKIEKNIENQMVICDFKSISSVLEKLISNAIEFGKVESVIHVTAKQKGSKLEVKIENQSEKDIPPKILKELLKPFQLNEDMMNHSKGLGLGLSISQALLKLNNSELKLKSNKNTFTASFQLGQ